MNVHAHTHGRNECARHDTGDMDITRRSSLRERAAVEARASGGDVVHMRATATAVVAHAANSTPINRRQRMYDKDVVANATATAAVSNAEVVVNEAAACNNMTHVKLGTQQARAKHGRCEEHATKHDQSHKRRADDACTRAAVATCERATQAAAHIQHSCDAISIAPAQQRNNAGDDVEAANDALTAQTAAVASAAVVDEHRAVATARSGPGRSCGREIPASDSKNTCNEMSIPASPELLAKINKKNTWKYKKI